MVELNIKAITENIFKKPPDSKTAFLFIVNHQELYKALIYLGYSSVLCDSDFTSNELIEIINSNKNDYAFSVDSYNFIPCLSRNENKKIIKACKECSLNYRLDGWKLFSECEQSDYNPELINSIVEQYVTNDDESSDELDVNKIGLVSLSDIRETQTEWLFTNRIPKGEITVFAGEGGTCKTEVICNLIASVSNHSYSIFDNANGIPQEWITDKDKVLFFSSEDDFSKVLIKRLKKYDADFSLIKTIEVGNESFKNIKFDSKLLKKILEYEKPSLCVFDPLQSFIPSDISMASRNEMRNCINTLIGYGHELGITFIILMHTNKRQGASGRDRMADSSDVWDIARSVFLFGYADRNGTRYISHEKSSYGKQSDTILFNINESGRLNFISTSDLKDYDYISSNSTRTRPNRDRAKEFILNNLPEGKKVKVKDISNLASADGISKHTFRRAKEELSADEQVSVFSEGFGQVKEWYISRLPTKENEMDK